MVGTMTTTILIVLLVLVVVGFGFVVYILDQRMKDLKENAGADFLKQDLLSITYGITLLKDVLQTHLTDLLD